MKFKIGDLITNGYGIRQVKYITNDSVFYDFVFNETESDRQMSIDLLENFRIAKDSDIKLEISNLLKNNLIKNFSDNI